MNSNMEQGTEQLNTQIAFFAGLEEGDYQDFYVDDMGLFFTVMDESIPKSIRANVMNLVSSILESNPDCQIVVSFETVKTFNLTNPTQQKYQLTIDTDADVDVDVAIRQFNAGSFDQNSYNTDSKPEA